MARKEPEGFEREKTLFSEIKFFLRIKPKHLWFFALCLSLEFIILGYFYLSAVLIPTYLPSTVAFNISNVSFDGHVRNLYYRNYVSQNDYVRYELKIRNQEAVPIRLYYKYSVFNAVQKENYEGDWLSVVGCLEPNKTLNATFDFPFTMVGQNFLGLKFRVYNYASNKLIKEEQLYTSFDVYSESTGREIAYRKITIYIALLAAVPAMIIAIKNLKELFKE